MFSKSSSTSSSKAKGLIWIALTVGAALILVLGIHRLAHLVPWSVEKRLGAWLDSNSGLTPCHRPNGLRALTLLTKRLYPLDLADRETPIEVTVIDNPEVNAFATYGGRIYLLSGLLKNARSPDEIAGVLAHEIEHVKGRHVLESTLLQLVSGAFSPRLINLVMHLKFSRDQESAADHGGLERLKRAQINPKGLSDFFSRMDQQGLASALFSDHPSPESRAELASGYPGFVAHEVLNSQEWTDLRKICR